MINLQCNEQYINWRKEFRKIANARNVDVRTVQTQFLYLHYLEGKTPEEAIASFEKVLIRINAINNEYKTRT